MKRKTHKEPDVYLRDKQGIIGEKPEYRDRPGHHTGMREEYGGPGSGYTLTEDGKYLIATCDRGSIESILAEEDSIRSLLNAIWDHAEKQHREVLARRVKWFSKMAAMLYRPDDSGLMRYRDGVVWFEKPTPPDAQKEK